jgi:hypothetical protein
MAAAFSLATRCGVEMLGTALAVAIGNAAVANHVLGFTKGHGMGYGWVAAAYGLGFSLAEVRARVGCWLARLRWRLQWPAAAPARSPPARLLRIALAQVACARVSNFLNPAVAIGFAVAGELGWPAFFAIAGAQVGGWRRGWGWRLPAAAAGKGACCCWRGRSLLTQRRLRCPPPRAAGWRAGGRRDHLAGVPAPLHGRRPGAVGGG